MQNNSRNQDISKESKSKTYQNVRILVTSGVQRELNNHLCKSKIKGMISFLANGEKKRGNFEYLVKENNLCSMRITKGDRLVFRPTWDDQGRLISAEIISVFGHYKSLKHDKEKKSFQIVEW